MNIENSFLRSVKQYYELIDMSERSISSSKAKKAIISSVAKLPSISLWSWETETIYFDFNKKSEV